MLNYFRQLFSPTPRKTTTYTPGELYVQVGSVELYAGRPGPGPMLGFGADLRIDGVSQNRVTAITLRISPEDVVTCEVEYLP